MTALPATYDIYHRRAVQKALNEKTQVQPPLTIDGNFGNMSVSALRLYQMQSDIPQSAVYDDATQALLEPFISQKYVLYPAIQSAASILGVDAATVSAVTETEASGAGFFPTGLCQIRFERHIMYQQLVKNKGQATANGLVNRYPSVVNPTPGGYATDPYTQLNLALTIDQTSAMSATSWGMFQIMGFNFTTCGYSTVQGYVQDMKTNETLQLQVFIHFCKSYLGGTLWTAMKNKDWTTFARIYNGTGAVASYSQTMANNYMLFTGSLAG
jgi:hypothetical protein